jgi:hypothetical protein
MLEWLLILVIILCISISYYTQSVSEYSLAQIKEIQISMQLAPLWDEKKPVVVSDVRPQEIWLANSLRQTKYWAAEPSWANYEQTSQYTPTHEGRTKEIAWAEILGISQIQNTALTKWFELTPWVFHTKTEAHIGPEGLRPTYGWATSYSCTQGTARCILLHNAQKAKLPSGWKGLRWKDATFAHHPLWVQVQYIEVVLRPGTTLLVPPHWIVAIEPSNTSPNGSETIWWIRSDVHHPISAMAQRLNEGT